MRGWLLAARTAYAALSAALAFTAPGCAPRTFGVGTVDAATPAGEDAAARPTDAGERPHTIVAADLCAPAVVAVSADGSMVGFLSCATGGPAVVTHELARGEQHSLGAAREGSTLTLSPDGALAVWQDEARRTVVRSAIEATAMSVLSALPVRALQMIQDDRSLWTIFLLADQGSGRSAVSVAREPFDSAPAVVLEGHDVDSLLADSARQRAYARDGQELVRISIDGTAFEGTAVRGERPELLSWGLSRDHGLVRDGDALWAVSFDDPFERVLLGTGWSGAAGSIAASGDSVYFVSSGELGRASAVWPPAPARIRPAPIEAVAVTIGADLFAVGPTEVDRVDPASGAASRLASLVPLDPPALVVARTWAAIATLDGIALVSSAGASGATVIAGAIRAETLGLDGLGGSACWIDAEPANDLRCASRASGPADRIAAEVRGWWPIPGSADLLAAVQTEPGVLELRRIDLEGP